MAKKTPVVLVVDDIELNRMILEEILKDDYEIVTASNGKEALETLGTLETLPTIILLDVIMPEMNGYQMLEILKSDKTLRKIPVIFITTTDTENDALSAGAVDFISKPFLPGIVKLRVKNQVELKNYSDSLEEMVEEKTAEATATLDNTLQALANIIEYRNLESGSHVKRTQFFCKALVDCLVMTDSPYADTLRKMQPDIIMKAMALHDVGKIGIPDSILLKPGKLNMDEFGIMKTHTIVGKNIVIEMMGAVKDKDSIYLLHCHDIAFSHHERYDGSGYPQGLVGNDIPLVARIASVADVYDALVSERVYKGAFSHEEAMRIIVNDGGKHFDPILTEAVEMIQARFMEISEQYR
ncbi:MAG TPA: two-component system response regulator [Treponema sp.]|nr:two-component system response regulator [Treponema sp.]